MIALLAIVFKNESDDEVIVKPVVFLKLIRTHCSLLQCQSIIIGYECCIKCNPTNLRVPKHPTSVLKHEMHVPRYHRFLPIIALDHHGLVMYGREELWR